MILNLIDFFLHLIPSNQLTLINLADPLLSELLIAIIRPSLPPFLKIHKLQLISSNF
jgi:hypothetical protein